MATDTQTIWKEMGEERRKSAAEAFYADTNLKEFHRAAELFIARNKNFRPAFVKKLPLEKRASYLAYLPLPPDLIGQLIVSYHFARQKPLMSAFLNALGIANDDGVISDSAEVTAPDKAALSAAAEKIKAEFPTEDVRIYFDTLQAQNPDTWGGLGEVISGSGSA
jgi:hypothetical protein